MYIHLSRNLFSYLDYLYNMHYTALYTCATNVLHVNKRFSILNLSGLYPLSCPLLPYLKVVCCPLNCPLSCPLSLAAHSLTTELPTFLLFEVLGCQLSYQLFPYMEVVSSLIGMAKFPWAAHSFAHAPPIFCGKVNDMS